jgi:hypothetical protein
MWLPSRFSPPGSRNRSPRRERFVRVDREYDLFEQFPDGSPMWRGRALGLPEVRRQLTELSRKTKNEYFAMHLSTKEVVARVNVGGHRSETQKRLIGQVAYDYAKGRTRTHALREQDYEVVTVVGNDAAKLVLDLSPNWSLFIIGEGPANDVRGEMASWLKERFPGVPILALNPPSAPVLDGADYNISHDDNLWMALVTSAFNGRARKSGDGFK